MKGMGVMINQLAGRTEDEVKAWRAVLGKPIAALEMIDDALHITTGDGVHVKLFDDGQSCCEHRYMMTDDDLSDFVGAVLLDADIRDGDSVEADYGDHETQFLIVKTDAGDFTMVTHNEHNGYYGGFYIRCEAVNA